MVDAEQPVDYPDIVLGIVLLLETSTLTFVGRDAGGGQNCPSRSLRREGGRHIQPGVWSRPKSSGKFRLPVWENMWENRGRERKFPSFK